MKYLNEIMKVLLCSIIVSHGLSAMHRGTIDCSKKLFERFYAKQKKHSTYFQKTKRILQAFKKEHSVYQRARLSDKQLLEELRAQQEILRKKIESCEVGLFAVGSTVIVSAFLWR